MSFSPGPAFYFTGIFFIQRVKSNILYDNNIYGDLSLMNLIKLRILKAA